MDQEPPAEEPGACWWRGAGLCLAATAAFWSWASRQPSLEELGGSCSTAAAVWPPFEAREGCGPPATLAVEP